MKIKKVYNLPGYHYRNEEIQAINAVMSINGVVKVLFVEGEPGTGKTFLGESFAEGQDWELVMYLCHSWTSDQEMFAGIDLSAAVAGDHNNVVEDGCLLRAAKISQKQGTVLLIDELDKAPERVENLLLDFLQSGRVPRGKGQFEIANFDNMLVIITSNGVREIGQAFLRRCRRLKIKQLPIEIQHKIVQGKTNLKFPVVRQVVRVCRSLTDLDGQSSSIQEMINLAKELELVENKEEIKNAILGWAVRGPNAENHVNNHSKNMIGEIASILGI